MKNEISMGQDPQRHTLSLGPSGGGTRDAYHGLGETVATHRLYGHDGAASSYWQGREGSAFDSSYGTGIEGGVISSDTRGRVNALMLDLVNKYRYSSAYLVVAMILAVGSEIVF